MFIIGARFTSGQSSKVCTLLGSGITGRNGQKPLLQLMQILHLGCLKVIAVAIVERPHSSQRLV